MSTMSTSPVDLIDTAAAPAPTIGAEELPRLDSAWAPSGSFDVRRLDLVTRLLGVSSLALFLALELPWYTTAHVSSTLGVSGSANAMVAGGWRFLIWIISLATVLLVTLEATTAWRPPPWFRREQVLLAATGANLLLVLVACFVARQMPPLGRSAAAAGQTVSMGAGAWLGLLFAVGAAASAFFAWRLRLASEDLPALTPEELHSPTQVWSRLDRRTIESAPADPPAPPPSGVEMPAAVPPAGASFVESAEFGRESEPVSRPLPAEHLARAAQSEGPTPEPVPTWAATAEPIVRPLREFGLCVDLPERRHVVRNPVTPRARLDYQASYERSRAVEIAEPGSDPPSGWMPPQPPPPPPL